MRPLYFSFMTTLRRFLLSGAVLPLAVALSYSATPHLRVLIPTPISAAAGPKISAIRITATGMAAAAAAGMAVAGRSRTCSLRRYS